MNKKNSSKKQPANQQRCRKVATVVDFLINGGSVTSKSSKKKSSQQFKSKDHGMKKSQGNQTTKNQVDNSSHRSQPSPKSKTRLSASLSKGPLDIAAMYAELREHYTLDEIAEKIGVSRRTVTRYRRLEELPTCLHSVVNSGALVLKRAYDVLELDADTLGALVEEVENGADAVETVEKYLGLPPRKRAKPAGGSLSMLIDQLLNSPTQPKAKEYSKVVELAERLETWRAMLEEEIEAANALLNEEAEDDPDEESPEEDLEHEDGEDDDLGEEEEEEQEAADWGFDSDDDEYLEDGDSLEEDDESADDEEEYEENDDVSEVGEAFYGSEPCHCGEDGTDDEELEGLHDGEDGEQDEESADDELDEPEHPEDEEEDEDEDDDDEEEDYWATVNCEEGDEDESRSVPTRKRRVR